MATPERLTHIKDASPNYVPSDQKLRRLRKDFERIREDVDTSVELMQRYEWALGEFDDFDTSKILRKEIREKCRAEIERHIAALTHMRDHL